MGGQEMMEVLLRGETNRSYASTEMNAESSRSHVIYRLMIEVKDEREEGIMATNWYFFRMNRKCYLEILMRMI